VGLKKRSKANAEFNMSSLTDIIFLLLIFFMLTSSSASSNILRLKLPQSASTTPSPQTFALSITNRSEYFVVDKQVDYNRLEEELLARIKEERAKMSQEADINEKELTIVLNVEQEVKTGAIVDAMKIANKLGVRLILSTDARARPEY
jgi:biopolymer transport protein ExbD